MDLHIELSTRLLQLRITCLTQGLKKQWSIIILNVRGANNFRQSESDYGVNTSADTVIHQTQQLYLLKM